MPTKAIMMGSAGVFVILGGVTLFFPQELVAALGLDPAAQLPVQLLAGGLFAIAVLNWTGRGAIYGGIYGRPIVLANFGFGTITGGSLISAIMDGALASSSWPLAGIFVAQALCFAMMMWRPPWPADSPSSAADPGT